MDYIALYTKADGFTDNASKVLLKSGEFTRLFNYGRDEQGLFFVDDIGSKIYDTGLYPYYPVEMSLCSTEVTAGSIAMVLTQDRSVKKVARVEGQMVWFTDGTYFPFASVRTRVATISTQVTFLNDGDIVHGKDIKWLAVNHKTGDSRKLISEPTGFLNNDQEYLLALIQCAHCGAFR